MSILKRNIKFNLFGQVVATILGFVSFKYIYSELGSDALGIIYFSIMLSAVFTAALDMGLSKTTIREVASYQIKEPEYIVKLSQTFSLFYWVAFGVVALTFVFFLPLIIDSWITLTTMSSDVARHVLLIIGTTSLLAIPKILLSSICIGMQRMDATNLIDVIMAIFQQLGIALFLINGKDIYFVAYWLAVTNVIRILIYMVFISSIISIKALAPMFYMSVVVRVKEYTVKMMWVSLLLVIHKQLDKILISKLLPIGNLGIYMFAFSSISKTAIITGSVAQAVFPHFSGHEKSNQKKESLDKYFMLQDLLVYGTVPLFSMAFFLAEPIFTYLLDEEMAKLLQLPVLFLCISFYLNSTLRMMSTYVSAVGKPEYIIDVTKFLLMVSIPIAVFLVIKFGMLGAAISWIVYYTLAAIYMVPKIYRGELDSPPSIWFRGVGAAIALTCFVYIPSWSMANAYFPESIISLLLFYCFGTIVYVVVALNMIEHGLQKAILNHIPIVRPLLFFQKIGS